MAAPRLHRSLIVAASVGLSIAWVASASAHDIPNARIDRSSQVILSPELLRVDYEVSLAELTLAQDLRQLNGEAFVGDRPALFERYARVVGPLNARGLVVRVDDRDLELQSVDFSIRIEDHLRFRFHFEAKLPDRGRLSILDTNYSSSEGSSRLGLRVDPGVEVSGDSPPTEVDSIPARLPWQLTDEEERRTKRLQVDFRPRSASTEVITSTRPAPNVDVPPRRTSPSGLTRMLDHSTGPGAVGWLITAFFLGMVHALQPGHGKTLVAAAGLGGPGASSRGVALGLITAGCHLVGVLAVAAVVWFFQTNQFANIHVGVARLSGVVVAAVGFFRLGRNLAGIDPIIHVHPDFSTRGLSSSSWTLGLAGGFVPCWDAVALVVLAGSVGRLGWGMILLLAFSLGLALVLVGVGWLAGRLQAGFRGVAVARQSRRWLGLASGFLLAAIGLGMLG